MGKFKALIKDLEEKITDLSELKVQTVTGDVSLILEKKSLEDLESLLKPAQGEAVETAKLKLILDTTIKFDGDSINFIGDGATADQIKVHKEAVEAGLKQRQGLLEMFKGLIS